MIDHSVLKIISVSSSTTRGLGIPALIGTVYSWVESNGIDDLFGITGNTRQKFGDGAIQLAPDFVVLPRGLDPNEHPNIEDTSNPRVVIEFEVCTSLPIYLCTDSVPTYQLIYLTGFQPRPYRHPSSLVHVVPTTCARPAFIRQGISCHQDWEISKPLSDPGSSRLVHC